MNLIIVESPTKARTLSRFLGKDYSLEATYGHIKDLPKSTLGVDVEHNFKPEHVVVEKREKEIKRLREQATKADKIYLATDPDREGEAIAKHVEEVIRGQEPEVNKKTKSKLKPLSSNLLIRRIVFHEITKEALEEAIEHPRSVDKNLVNAQIARRVLDRLVGYKLSPLLWKKVRRGLSAGRVQTVTVRLIVEREREIAAFKQEEYWEIYCNLKTQISKLKTEEFIVKLIKFDDKRAEIKNKKEAGIVVFDLEKSDYKIADVIKKEIRKNPYPPFTTSTMAQAAARLYHWSSKKTMSVAQSLYEQGLITYHRTDSTYLAQTAVDKVRKFIEKEYGGQYLPDKARFYKVRSKVAQEAHEAIRPTNIGMTNDKFQMTNGRFVSDAKVLYGLIWKKFVACQMVDSIFDETVINVQAKTTPEVKDLPTSRVYVLRASGQVMKFDGWRKVIPLSKYEEPGLPMVGKDEALDLVKVLSEQKFTEPPPRYNEASLIKTLEKLGIGRPSTYAPTISTIQVRQYVEKDEGKFKPTPVGLTVNDFLIGNFESIFDYQFTAQMEDDLDNVAKGNRKWQEMMGEFYSPFEKKLESVEKKAKRVEIPVEKLGKKCPKCKDGELVVRVGRFGKFVSCSRFPDCDYKEKYLEKIGMKCPDCKKGDVIVKTTKRRRKFYGCSSYPTCKWASWNKPEIKGATEKDKEIKKKTLSKLYAPCND
ncbi:DNA topoisomerase I [Candidatus Woesebacteria bacterium RIFCSPHIGHO2_01_FULL_38_10]|uniref:DNA topoisomerase 1 n=1 Tax=Candidatus Woesebacteria bacterium RIFCSPLOWO2_01_FULL_39_10b TaxID=1802517 RepID=A0A1F8B6Q3_9BACT|nr:MAG: DNA topoisomerase I [Candidatus Woesebacteria bacterium RIFCSPHIGHO2_01_FULL_38_10]OGM59610.1 MAG: DNA topoisomerase I [Candidatus Woesebacteria bacterium RIFCSPLOWO2_01_FULL_39_10b]